MGKIVVIDDHSEVRDIIKEALENEGHEVYTAINGETGIQLITQYMPQIVITDILMPVKEGVNVVRSVRYNFPDTKIIVISGADRRENYFETAKSFGADEILSKPIDLDVLIDMVGKYS